MPGKSLFHHFNDLYSCRIQLRFFHGVLLQDGAQNFPQVELPVGIPVLLTRLWFDGTLLASHYFAKYVCRNSNVALMISWER